MQSSPDLRVSGLFIIKSAHTGFALVCAPFASRAFCFTGSCRYIYKHFHDTVVHIKVVFQLFRG